MTNRFDPRTWSGPVLSKSREFSDACVTKFRLSVNECKGGDAGHGARLMLTVEDRGGTDMEVRHEEGKISILFSGDAEIRNAALGLRFAAFHANKQLKMIK